MTKTRKIALWVVVGLVVSTGVVGLVVGPAEAQQRRAAAAQEEDDDFGPGAGRMAMVRALLDLTDQQVEQARALHQSFRDDTSALRDQVRAKFQEVGALFAGGAVSKADLLAKQREIHDLMGRIGEQRIEKLYGFWEILSAEQQVKLGGLISERLEDGTPGFGGFGLGGGHGRGHGRGHGMGRGGPGGF